MSEQIKPRIIIVIPIGDDLVEGLAKHCDVAERPAGGWTRDRVIDALPEADGVIINGAIPVDQEWLDSGRRLRVLSNRGAGVDNIDIEHASSIGILVCNTPRVLSGAVADVVFGMMLMLSRRLMAAQEHIRSGAWFAGKMAPFGNDPRGKVLGILGLGDIGKAVARTARGFDMKVIYHQPRRVMDAENSGEIEYVSRDELFRRSDFLSVHCALTPDTHRSIGAAEFGMMKPSAYFLNTARGTIVDQSALIDALEANVIAGAGLDVMEKEPLAPDSPLCSLPNVILLPHLGSLTFETRRAMEELAVRNLLDGLAGLVPAAPVNPDVLISPEHLSRRRSSEP